MHVLISVTTLEKRRHQINSHQYSANARYSRDLLFPRVWSESIFVLWFLALKCSGAMCKCSRQMSSDNSLCLRSVDELPKKKEKILLLAPLLTNCARADLSPRLADCAQNKCCPPPLRPPCFQPLPQHAEVISLQAKTQHVHARL